MAEVALGSVAFADQAARSKSALHGHFVFALALYPFVMGATLAARSSWMSVVNPRPHISGSPPAPRKGPDLWQTDDPITIASTILAFVLILFAHCNLLTHLTLRRIPGAPRIARKYSGLSAITLLLCTTSYYLNYLRSSRYVVSPTEWTIFAIATSILVVVTVFIVLVPLKQEQVVKLGQAPAAL